MADKFRAYTVEDINAANLCPSCDALGICPSHKWIHDQISAERAYPNHSKEAAFANWKAGREIWDTNGDLW